MGVSRASVDAFGGPANHEQSPCSTERGKSLPKGRGSAIPVRSRSITCPATAGLWESGGGLRQLVVSKNNTARYSRFYSCLNNKNPVYVHFFGLFLVVSPPTSVFPSCYAPVPLARGRS